MAVIVAPVGDATGSEALAAGLAAVAASIGGEGLLASLASARRPRPTIVASAAARDLEERLAGSVPGTDPVARGNVCQLAVPGDRDGIEGLAAAAAASSEDALWALHAPPHVFRLLVDYPGFVRRVAVLRADLDADLALTALAVGELLAEGIPVRVVKRPLGRIAARRAVAGISPGPGTERGLRTMLERLIGEERDVAA
jgi:hypothetical protein